MPLVHLPLMEVLVEEKVGINLLMDLVTHQVQHQVKVMTVVYGLPLMLTTKLVLVVEVQEQLVVELLPIHRMVLMVELVLFHQLQVQIYIMLAVEQAVQVAVQVL